MNNPNPPVDPLLQIGMFCEWQRADLDIAIRLHQLTPEERIIKTAKLEVYNEVLQKLTDIEEELQKGQNNSV